MVYGGRETREIHEATGHSLLFPTHFNINIHKMLAGEIVEVAENLFKCIVYMLCGLLEINLLPQFLANFIRNISFSKKIILIRKM